MTDKILAVFAHPDDESFGPGGTLAKWAREGSLIHLICATKGEAGRNSSKNETGKVREQELLKAAKIIGIQKVEFLEFIDGKIGNNDLKKLEQLITQKITTFKPDALITYDLSGVSGHLDHIAVASATTQAFKKTKIAQKIYYYCIDKKISQQYHDYFVHFPEGKTQKEVDLVIDTSSVWDKKIRAMRAHISQIRDVEHILKHESREKLDYFIVKTTKDFPQSSG